MFKDYESKPVTRRAMKITEDMDFDIIDDSTMTCYYKMSDTEKTYVDFKHHQEVEVGDYIVYLNDDDIYHCDAKVFAERNIVD